MGSLIGLLVGKTLFGKTITEPIARMILTAGLFLAVLGIIGGVVAFIRHDAVADHEAKIERRVAPANDLAAHERAADTIATSKHEQELHDAIQAQPDQPIAPTSHALSCKRLHDAGRDPAACR